MARELSELEVNGLFKYIIGNWNINRITYNVTYWEIRFISPVNSKPDELYLIAAEIDAPNIDLWNKAMKSLPIDLSNTHEPNDTIVAIQLMTAINRHGVGRVLVEQSGNLVLEFNNSTNVICKAEVEQVDWTWQIFDEEKTFCITCDSGPIYLSGSYPSEWLENA